MTHDEQMRRQAREENRRSVRNAAAALNHALAVAGADASVTADGRHVEVAFKGVLAEAFARHERSEGAPHA